ncbi:MAG: chromosome segregation protein SMC [bacterium]
MHISELQLVGFKSFQDKTTLRFSSRMNAVIGPNGCGKTNILDALRWVLGEQSSTVLRCAKNEDLIFGGTATIAPTNLAEVRLVLANDSLPEYPAEIEIRRRYFRTGESEYYLNRQPCRMKDIMEVFLQSGIGTRAYSIFDLRQMREIIAGNVRRMFEEAATLAKYREAKADCLRKLELTEADLVRLDDIIAERERVVRSLRRQSGRLRVWEKLRAEERDLRLLELKEDYEAAARDAAALSRDVEALEAAEAERLNDIHRLEAELARSREQVREVQSRKELIATEMRRRRDALAGVENRDLVTGQRTAFLEEDAARADADREELARSMAELEEAFNQAVRKLEQANARQQELQAELEKAQQETAQAEQKLHELRVHGQSVRESFQGLLEKRNAVGSREDYLVAVGRNLAENAERLARERDETRARLAQLRAEREEAGHAAEAATEALERARQQLADGEAALTRSARERAEIHRALLASRERRGRLEKELAVLRSALPDLVTPVREQLGERVRGEIGGYLEIEEGWERACEAALQSVLQFLVVAGGLSSEELARLAEHGPESGCGLVTESEPGGAAPADPGTPESLDLLSRHVGLRLGCPMAVARAVGSAVVAGDNADLEALARRLPGRLLVNRRGYARLEQGGYVVAGPARGRLRLERQLADTAAGLARAEEELAGLAARESGLESAAVALHRQVEEARATLVKAERVRGTTEVRSETLGARLAEVEREEARLLSELEQAGNSRRENERALATVRLELEALDAKVESQTAVQRRVDEEAGTREQEARDRLARASERLARLSDGRQQVSRLESERDFLRRSIEERRQRATGLEQRAAAARADAARLAEEREASRPELAAAREEIAALEARAGELSVADLVRSEEELERNLAEHREARERNQALLLDQRMTLHAFTQQREAIRHEAATEYGTDIVNFKPGAEENVAGRLAEIRDRLAALGQVNPLAVEEHEQERKDLDKLAAQRADVVAARENLIGSMAEIDRHARERFLETYSQVREHFREAFRQMFLAGEADLELLDEQNPLESDIVITARPRGKNPKRLEQLSDGEKALLAVSLLFAFYRVKPAPFCFLDEIDAPLDDANVGRFADYLKQMSAHTQVVIITHNRVTVERADSLFGVTAEQPGVSKLVSVNLAEYRDSEAGASVS